MAVGSGLLPHSLAFGCLFTIALILLTYFCCNRQCPEALPASCCRHARKPFGTHLRLFRSSPCHRLALHLSTANTDSTGCSRRTGPRRSKALPANGGAGRYLPREEGHFHVQVHNNKVVVLSQSCDLSASSIGESALKPRNAVRLLGQQ